ncbi:ATP-binding cassette sub-family C member 4-like [Boleophthalmus pectinirostris]|uniref:ATP-binding cassette sub-family C member 4-like n=1 Tax=Boleophthalmus pectinirostris TaxID=150288 RepID=UPI00242C19BF|nr:ATP-binding cassette sub-family C member 4-like [Boleophthalmus pectinirostris]
MTSKSSPLAHAGCLSRLFLCWLSPLLQLGKKQRLEESDMYNVLEEDRSETLGKELQSFWDREVRKSKKQLSEPSLTKVLFQCYGASYAKAGLFAFSLEAIKVIQPLLLGKIILFFENYDPNDDQSLWLACTYAAAISLSTFGLTFLQHLYYYNSQRIGMKMRVAVCHMIFKKALQLSTESVGRTTTGQIVNLLSNDVNRFDEITLNLHYLWIGPLQAAVILALLWYEIGLSCLAGVTIVALMLPLQTWFGKLFGLFRSKSVIFTDNRIRIMNEVVSGIRIIKMYAWEKPFSALLTGVRKKEIHQIMKSSYLRGLNMASFFASSKIIVFFTFTVYALLGNAITASSVFVTVSLYGTIKLTVTLFFPLAVEKVSETRVSIFRIRNYLLLDEVERNDVVLALEDKEIPVELHDMSLDAPSLQSVSITVKPQQLLAVIGPVGAGKDADIYLLDDPLSAVDAEVGKFLFDQGSQIYNLMPSSVTHQLQYLKGADHIIVLNGDLGHIVAQGTYQGLTGSGFDMVSLLNSDEELWPRTVEELQTNLLQELEPQTRLEPTNTNPTAHRSCSKTAAYILQDWWLVYW